jgi:hypothetical protein
MAGLENITKSLLTQFIWYKDQGNRICSDLTSVQVHNVLMIICFLSVKKKNYRYCLRVSRLDGWPVVCLAVCGRFTSAAELWVRNNLVFSRHSFDGHYFQVADYLATGLKNDPVQILAA